MLLGPHFFVFFLLCFLSRSCSSLSNSCGSKFVLISITALIKLGCPCGPRGFVSYKLDFFTIKVDFSRFICLSTEYILKKGWFLLLPIPIKT